MVFEREIGILFEGVYVGQVHSKFRRLIVEVVGR